MKWLPSTHGVNGLYEKFTGGAQPGGGPGKLQTAPAKERPEPPPNLGVRQLEYGSVSTCSVKMSGGKGVEAIAACSPVNCCTQTGLNEPGAEKQTTGRPRMRPIVSAVKQPN